MATTTAEASVYATTPQGRAGAANYVHQLAQVDLETERQVLVNEVLERRLERHLGRLRRAVGKRPRRKADLRTRDQRELARVTEAQLPAARGLRP